MVSAKPILISPLDSAVTRCSKSITNCVKHGTNYCSTLYVSVKYRVMHEEVDNRSVTGVNGSISNKITTSFTLNFKTNLVLNLVLNYLRKCKYN